MNRAGAHDREQAVVSAMKNSVNRLACFENGSRGLLGNGELAQHMGWRQEFFDFFDP
jgi:hypothetical protein